MKAADAPAPPVRISGVQALKEAYDRLGPGDVFIGAAPADPLRPAVLIDLLERGVRCVPSALSRMLNHSKAFQAMIFRKWMPPHTFIIRRRLDLLDAMNAFHRDGVGAAVTKEDHMHCGHGIRKWDNIESLYNHMAFAENARPFVVQEYMTGFRDVRAIIVGDYVEAYRRENPHNFRQNMAAGGQSAPFSLDPDAEAFCRAAMERGKFPYAHVDIFIMDSGERYLSEIALNGGMKGARISRPKLDGMKREIVEALAEDDATPSAG